MMAGSRMYDQTDRFVDDDNIVILVDNFKTYFLGNYIGRFRSGDCEFDNISGLDAITGSNSFPINQNMIISDKALKPSPG